MVYPCIAQFCYTKVEYKGVHISRTCFPDAETVAEALVSILSRVGVSSAIFSDLGSQYATSIMKDVKSEGKKDKAYRCLQHNVTDDALEHFHTNIREQITYDVYGSLFQVKSAGESTSPPMQLSEDPNIPDTHNLQNILLIQL